MTLIFGSVFEQDFAELVTLLSGESSPDVALRFEQSTYRTLELLLKHPELGRLRKDLAPEGIRSFRIRGFNRYLLFYLIQRESLILLRLRFGGMNLQSLFLSWG